MKHNIDNLIKRQDPIKDEIDPADYGMDEGDIRFMLVAERVQIICRCISLIK